MPAKYQGKTTIKRLPVCVNSAIAPAITLMIEVSPLTEADKRSSSVKDNLLQSCRSSSSSSQAGNVNFIVVNRGGKGQAWEGDVKLKPTNSAVKKRQRAKTKKRGNHQLSVEGGVHKSRSSSCSSLYFCCFESDSSRRSVFPGALQNNQQLTCLLLTFRTRDTSLFLATRQTGNTVKQQNEAAAATDDSRRQSEAKRSEEDFPGLTDLSVCLSLSLCEDLFVADFLFQFTRSLLFQGLKVFFSFSWFLFPDCLHCFFIYLVHRQYAVPFLGTQKKSALPFSHSLTHSLYLPWHDHMKTSIL